LDARGEYFFVGSGGGGGGGYGIILDPKQDFSLRYLMGILNSRLLNFYLVNTSTQYRGGYIALNRQYIEEMPIRLIDFSSKADKARHDRMVKLVELMLELQNRFHAARIPTEKTVIQRQIDATDKQIDTLVYDLYELTEEEIAIVEETAKKS
jgi:hypothetical protein